MLQLQGQTPARGKKSIVRSHLAHMEPTGASAESTQGDQLGGQKNARDADGAIVAADHPGAQQRFHTADYWLHIYTPLGLCLHIHTDFRAVAVTCEGVLTLALVLTRVCV